MSASPEELKVDSTHPDGFVHEAFALALQHSVYNQAIDTATFARLLCVSKALQTALETAAVGCLSVNLTFSTSGSPARFITDPEWPVPVSQQQLAWVAKHLQHGHIRQLRLSGLSARSIQRYGSGLSAAVPELECLWNDIREWADHYDSYTICGVLVIIHHGGTPAARPQLSPCITQLTLGIEEHRRAPDWARERWPAALQELPHLTSLQELELPVFNPPEGALAPALSCLTSLTKLFIRHPLPPEQQALPVSLQHLTVAREFDYIHGSYPGRLPPLMISHLTVLDTLVIREEHWGGSNGHSEIINNCYWMCEGVPAGSLLPDSLQHLVVKGVHHVQPLLALTRLQTLTITHPNSGLYRGRPQYGGGPGAEQLLALTQLTSLTRVVIKGQPAVLQQRGLPELIDALPVHLSDPEPASWEEEFGGGSREPGTLPVSTYCGTAFNTGVVRVVTTESRGCSIWTGVKVVVDMLMGRHI